MRYLKDVFRGKKNLKILQWWYVYRFSFFLAEARLGPVTLTYVKSRAGGVES